MVRILVTGSRNWTDYEAVKDAIRRAADGHNPWEVTVVHGFNPNGADRLAAVAARALGVREEPHPADWRQYGPSAGPRRNREMVKLGADLCLAFILSCQKVNCSIPGPHGSHGASDCALEAKMAGIRTISDERWS